ncbi:MAG: hypothetical protein HQL58_12085 [Magnetococcales bacterium]|nr:hypothetical protein [Magnetococcales bacterium]
MEKISEEQARAIQSQIKPLLTKNAGYREDFTKEEQRFFRGMYRAIHTQLLHYPAIKTGYENEPLGEIVDAAVLFLSEILDSLHCKALRQYREETVSLGDQCRRIIAREQQAMQAVD